MQASPSSTGAAAALPLQTRLFHAALERVERHLHRLQVEEAQVQSEEHEVAQFAVLYRTPPSDPPPPSAVTPLLLRLSLLRQDLLLHPHLPPQPTPSSILSPPAFLSSSPSSSSSTPSSLLQQQSTLRSLQSSALSLSSSLISRTAHTRAQRQTALHDRITVELTANTSRAHTPHTANGWLIPWYDELTEYRRVKEAAKRRAAAGTGGGGAGGGRGGGLALDDDECCHAALRAAPPSTPPSSLSELASSLPQRVERLTFTTRYRHLLVTCTITRGPAYPSPPYHPSTFRYSLTTDIALPGLSAAFDRFTDVKPDLAGAGDGPPLPKSSSSLSFLTSRSSPSLPSSRSFSAFSPPPPPLPPPPPPHPSLLSFIRLPLWLAMLDHLQPPEGVGGGEEEEERRRKEREVREEKLKERERVWRLEIQELEKEEEEERKREERERREKKGRDKEQDKASRTAAPLTSTREEARPAPPLHDATDAAAAVRRGRGREREREDVDDAKAKARRPRKRTMEQ